MISFSRNPGGVGAGDPKLVTAQEFHFTPSDHAIFSDNEDAVVAKDTLKAKSLLAMDALASSHGMAMSQVMGLNNFVPWKGTGMKRERKVWL